MSERITQLLKELKREITLEIGRGEIPNLSYYQLFPLRGNRAVKLEVEVFSTSLRPRLHPTRAGLG